MITPAEAAAELLRRRKAKRELLAYIQYTSPGYKVSRFAIEVCAALDKFLLDVKAGVRPIIVFQAPPQHGKTEIVSRKLAAFIMGLFPDWYIQAASYSSPLAKSISTDVRRNLASPAHQRLFPKPEGKRPYTVNKTGEFTSPNGNGGYIGDGVGGGFTGRPATIFLIDDPIKNSQEALSPATKAYQWNWYQSTSMTRMAEKSGTIIMATSWAIDDLAGKILTEYAGNPRLTVLRFPAINDPTEAGYRPDLPLGALVPELHSLQQLLEIKGTLSDYWWSAMYQSSAKPAGGNVFKDKGIRYYLPSQLPQKFEKIIDSWDCTFKDTDGTDYVVGQKWGKIGADAYLLKQVRARMSFTSTVQAVVELRNSDPRTTSVLIEDKANGPAVIDTLKKVVPGILPIEPDGSKLARAHAVTWVWEAGNVHTPDPSVTPWAKAYIDEMTTFPSAPNDDQVDCTSQALRHLFPFFSRLNISQEAINKVLGIR